MWEVKQINTKNRTYYFTMTWSILKMLSKTCYKLTENHTKTLVFTTLDILQLKKIDDCENIYSVNPLYLLANHARWYIEEKMKINI